MQSSLISKVEKARRYAEEKDRISVMSLKVSFRGDHSDHAVELDSGVWACTCHYFADYGTCSHVMALERILEPMVAQQAPISAEA